MKKSFLYAMAAIATLAGCADNDGYSGQTVTDGESPVAVSFGVSSQGLSQDLLVQPKGTGTVGDITEEANVWKGQLVRVYMMNSGTLDPTTVTIGTVESSFKNTPVKTPYGLASGAAFRADEQQCYYPVTGASDFWGYRTDGAEAGEPETTDCEMRVPFVIDGTQDLMTGKTAPVDGVPSNSLFSAYTARLGIVPNIVFSHQLTRLTFTAKCYGDYKQYGSNAEKLPVSEVAPDDIITLPDGSVTTSRAIAYREMNSEGYVNKGLYVDSILVETKTGGKMYFAWSPKANLEDDRGYARIVWNDATDKYLSLKQRPTRAMYFAQHPEMDPSGALDVDTLNLVNLVGMQPNELTETRIGEAMMVAPQNTYKIKVYMHQYLERYDQDALDEYYQRTGFRREQQYILQRVVFPNPDVADYYDVDLKAAVGDNVKAGYSYKILLNVTGTERIDLDATLTPWKEGGATDIDLE